MGFLAIFSVWVFRQLLETQTWTASSGLGAGPLIILGVVVAYMTTIALDPEGPAVSAPGPP